MWFCFIGFFLHIERITEGHVVWDETGYEGMFECERCGAPRESTKISWRQDLHMEVSVNNRWHQNVGWSADWFMFYGIATVFEPPHDKTTRMACAPSEDSDQPGHPSSLIRVFAVRMKKAWVLSYPLSAQRRLVRLGRCPGWSESSLGAHAILSVLSQGGSFQSYNGGQLRYSHCSLTGRRRPPKCFTSTTVNFLNIRTPQKIVVITLKFEHCDSNIMSPNDAKRIANSVDPDQTAPLGRKLCDWGSNLWPLDL